jgi:hypothetical protein
MPVKSGAGAAVSSGADYQARVAAYLIASVLCHAAVTDLTLPETRSIGFETAESIDDINISFSNDRHAYLQIKKELSFSTLKDSELYDVIRQFSRQYSAHPHFDGDFLLVTTSSSSRKVTSEMKAALEAYRLGDEVSFRRDQPKEKVAIVDELLDLIVSLLEVGTESDRRAVGREILRRSRVLVLDLDPDSSLEQAVILILRANSFVAADQLWRRIISDCLTHSAQRHTISIEQLRGTYGKFAEPEGPTSPAEENTFLIRQLDENEVPVGKEVVLGTLGDAASAKTNADLFIFELIRFSDTCSERIVFQGGTCMLGNGFRINLERRTATYQGMTRFLASNPSLTRDRKVMIVPANTSEDLEHNLCAERHRQLLRAKLQENKNLLKCLHCGKPVSSADADHVETAAGGEIRVGLTHSRCTRVDDRVLGVIKSPFFERFGFLKNFDVNLWFKAVQRGQGVFRASSDIAAKANIGWRGVASTTPPGDYVVEAILEGGESEFLHHRGKIHRFFKAGAEAAVEECNGYLTEARQESDPICSSDQSKAVARRTTLLKMLGVSEKLREILSFRTARYDERVASRYELWSNWYAPLAFLRSLGDGAHQTLGNYLPVITNPLKIDRYLDNWKAANFEVPDFEVHILKEDREFDDFVLEALAAGFQIVADPLFSPDGRFTLVSGLPVIPISALMADDPAFPGRKLGHS